MPVNEGCYCPHCRRQAFLANGIRYIRQAKKWRDAAEAYLVHKRYHHALEAAENVGKRRAWVAEERLHAKHTLPAGIEGCASRQDPRRRGAA